MNITIHKAQLSNLVEVSKLFDAYRVFYKQKSDLSLALDFLRQRLENSQSVIFYAKNDQDEYLSNISANKIQLSMDYQDTHWQARLKLKHRLANNNVAQGEQQLDKANIIEANWLIELNNQWQLTFWVDNLLNDSYTLTADKKASLSFERQLGIRLTWQND